MNQHVVILAREEYKKHLENRFKELTSNSDIVTVISNFNFLKDDARSRIKEIMDFAKCDVKTHCVSLILHDRDIFGENRAVCQSRCGNLFGAFYCTFHHDDRCKRYLIINDKTNKTIEDLKTSLLDSNHETSRT